MTAGRKLNGQWSSLVLSGRDWAAERAAAGREEGGRGQEIHVEVKVGSDQPRPISSRSPLVEGGAGVHYLLNDRGRRTNGRLHHYCLRCSAHGRRPFHTLVQGLGLVSLAGRTCRDLKEVTCQQALFPRDSEWWTVGILCYQKGNA
ncbi:hypothetical protein PoB_006625300 [Plakobranchus ocellatus]|uniref:Uncharacterized protein n=1 Tax=Plakobranchus ocellatus TaxID=259542 RepID=A0AAV4D6A4_9GAST|nr:hypothetical protein PoB_006625300 [Plakobranchus ocellatus]